MSMPNEADAFTWLAKLATLLGSAFALLEGLFGDGSPLWVALGCLGLLSLVWQPEAMAMRVGMLAVMLAVVVALVWIP